MVAAVISKAKYNYCSLGLQPQGFWIDVLVAQLFRVILVNICDISANSKIQSCADAPIEAIYDAETSLATGRTKKCVCALCMQIYFPIHSD